MKKLTLYFAIVACIAGVYSANAQTVRYACAANEAWQRAITIDPSLVLRRQQMEILIDQYVSENSFSRDADSNAIHIIPVVFHVIEQGGSENIPDSQIYNAIQVFNEDYRKMNWDTIHTPAAFKPVAADFKIEFRIATKDPNGNCTNGINRVFSHRTNGFNDYAKSLIDWPSDRYLNIWVCSSIGENAEKGIVIGYAQFPVTGPSATDGVVLQNDFVGRSGGTAQTFYAGRDGTHEIGHYFDLIHTWGDAVCGDDKCADTPTQDSADFGCPAYPHITCGNDGDMSDNYMDYSDGDCKDIFTLDQKARAVATLNTARYTMWQESNLEATGTDDVSYSNPASCAPVADFFVNHSLGANFSNRVSICPGTNTYFRDNSTLGTVASWSWSFPGGTPSSSSVQDPGPITYSTPGTYAVSLTVNNAQGSSTVNRAEAVIVGRGSGDLSAPSSESFEEGTFPPGEWRVFNDDGGPAWQQTNRAAYTGNYSASIQNHETLTTTAPGSVKELVSPAYNFTYVSAPVLSFRLSYGTQYTGNADSLSVGVSLNCGMTWTEIMRFGSGPPVLTMPPYATLSLSSGSGGFEPGDFAPTTPDEWQLLTIPLSTYAGQGNVMFHFYFRTDVLSNNLYLDDININGTVGINEFQNPYFSFNAVPNPASGLFTIHYDLKHHENISINMYDLQGRLVKEIESTDAEPGSYQTVVDGSSFNLASGVYMLRMITGDGIISRKLVYTGN